MLEHAAKAADAARTVKAIKRRLLFTRGRFRPENRYSPDVGFKRASSRYLTRGRSQFSKLAHSVSTRVRYEQGVSGTIVDDPRRLIELRLSKRTIAFSGDSVAG